MSPEERFAQEICRALDAGVADLDPVVSERLRAARVRALAARSTAARVAEVANIGAGGTAALGNGDRETELHPWRTFFAILMLIVGMGATYYWNGFEAAETNEAIDSALLADDLPPRAYLDPGFQAWISHYTQESAR
jgi:hypothetical protein